MIRGSKITKRDLRRMVNNRNDLSHRREIVIHNSLVRKHNVLSAAVIDLGQKHNLLFEEHLKLIQFINGELTNSEQID